MKPTTTAQLSEQEVSKVEILSLKLQVASLKMQLLDDQRQTVGEEIQSLQKDIGIARVALAEKYGFDLAGLAFHQDGRIEGTPRARQAVVDLPSIANSTPDLS